MRGRFTTSKEIRLGQGEDLLRLFISNQFSLEGLTGGPDFFPIEFAVFVAVKTLEELGRFFGTVSKLESLHALEDIKGELLELVSYQDVVMVLISHLEHLSNHCLKFLGAHVLGSFPGVALG